MGGYNQGEKYQQKMLCYLMLFMFIMSSMLGASVKPDEYTPSTSPNNDPNPTPTNLNDCLTNPHFQRAMMRYALYKEGGENFAQFTSRLPESEKRALDGCVWAAQEAVTAGMSTAVDSLIGGITGTGGDHRSTMAARDNGDHLIFGSRVPVAEAVPVMTAEAVVASMKDTPLNALVNALVVNGDISRLQEMKDSTLQAVKDKTQREDLVRYFDGKIKEAARNVKPSAPEYNA